jgi:hypothetical protein
MEGLQDRAVRVYATATKGGVDLTHERRKPIRCAHARASPGLTAISKFAVNKWDGIIAGAWMMP